MYSNCGKNYHQNLMYIGFVTPYVTFSNVRPPDSWKHRTKDFWIKDRGNLWLLKFCKTISNFFGINLKKSYQYIIMNNKWEYDHFLQIFYDLNMKWHNHNVNLIFGIHMNGNDPALFIPLIQCKLSNRGKFRFDGRYWRFVLV